jgi:hypothetical protein
MFVKVNAVLYEPKEILQQLIHSVANTMLIQQTYMFHDCTITNQNKTINK